ncbi:GntR family transcriptional regulator [Kitasatospora aureofaciens]|uniref:GntR family transcriptional regulator n=1 Tax=Kitasatospora aureofaciens TaxID=1894 RepID=UPI0033BBAF68
MPEIQRSLPPYQQVIAHYKEKINNGELQPGDRVPSDRQLAEEWGISRVTAQKVLTAMRSEGLIETTPGLGSTVRDISSTQHHSAADRIQTARRTGRIYRPGEYARILSAEVVPAPEDVADALGIEAGSPAIRRVRVTYSASDQPTSASTSWYDGTYADIAPRLLEAERIKEGTVAYLEAQIGKVGVKGQDRIAVRAATDEDARALAVEVGSPIKVGRNFLHSEDGTVIEYGISIAGPGRESAYDYIVS